MILDKGFITNIRRVYDDTIVEVMSSYDRRFTSFHIIKCRTFSPEVGDFVHIIDNDVDWYVIKEG